MPPSARLPSPAETGRGAIVRTVLPAQEVTDSELVERARGGNHWAEEMLYRRHSAFIVGLCTRLLRQPNEADDVVQDAFVSAFERLSQLHETSQFRSWLASIAVRQAHRRLRRRKFQRLFQWATSDEEDPANSIASMALSPEWTTELAKLDDALRRLSDAHRVPWQLRYVEGYRVEAVAELCQCSLATVKRRIARADAHIRKYLNYAEIGHE
jgi:RNA polymerase sigma-70 factor (ECF subfamily)